MFVVKIEGLISLGRGGGVVLLHYHITIVSILNMFTLQNKKGNKNLTVKNDLTNMCRIKEFQLILNQSKGHTIQGQNGCFSILFLVGDASTQKIHHIWFIVSLQFTHSPASSVKEPLHIPRKASLGCNTAHKTVSDTEQSIPRSYLGQRGQELSHIRHTQARKNFWQQFQ